jgi:chemotaxis protein methyltransferase CheR
MNDRECVRFLQDFLPGLHLRWPGFRRVRRQVCKRVQRRCLELALSDVQAYRGHLAAHPAEWSVLDGLCRITISRFYRDRAVFACLERIVFPELIRSLRGPGEQALRIWSAGCASGEEPGSLALMWEFSLALLFPGIKLHILATDADAAMLRRAREGCYSLSSLRELPARWREQAFRMNNGGYCLRSRYRKAIKIVSHDVRQGIPDGPFHLLLCRNLVFTYFDEQLACDLGCGFWQGLQPGGGLVIGAHEQLPVALHGFEPWRPCRAIYRRMPAG